MDDYQTHYQKYSQIFETTSAMHLSYLQARYGGHQLDDASYASQSWQHKPSYVEQACSQPPGSSMPLQRNNSMLYASEFADPHSNLEIGSHDLSPSYSTYSSISGYPVSLEGTQSGGVHRFDETVAPTLSYLPDEPVYGASSPPAGSSTRYHSNIPSDSFPLSWPNSNSFQAPPASDTPPFRCSPITVKSQRPISQDLNGFDTPPSPFSLARSKHSSTSPSPGPLTPAICHIPLEADLYAAGFEGRPSPQGSSRNLYTPRDEDVDPDRPYPCSSCRMAFARQHDLTRHSRVHSGETPYHCRGCHQGFRRSDARSRHWGKEASCLALHQRLVEGTEEGRKLEKSLSRLGDKSGRIGTSTFRVKPQTRGIGSSL